MDRVLVNKLVIDQLVLSPAPWADSKHQVAYLDVVIYTDTSKAGATDDLNFSTSYAAVAKGLRKLFTEANYQNRPALTAHELAEEAAKWTLFSLDPPLTSKNDQVEVCATFPEALLHGGILSAKVRRCLEDFGRERILSHDSENARSDSLSIDSLEISTIIGLNDCEREEEQPLLVSLTTWPNFEGIVAADSMAWSARSLQQTAWKHVRSNHPLLLETLCPTLSAPVIEQCNVPKVRVRLDKPKAVMWTSTTAVETIRHRNFFSTRTATVNGHRTTMRSLSTNTSAKVAEGGEQQHTAYIAIGSNLGDRVAYIRKALGYLDDISTMPASNANTASSRTMKLVDTSFLYESEPMYVLEQAPFLNAVCKISTSLSPQELLAACKSIESHIGRRKTIDKGPREIDLDVLLYNATTILRDNEVDLTIPHPLISEREFVLRPLADIAPKLVHPILKQDVLHLLNSLPIGTTQLRKVAPLPFGQTPLSFSPTSCTIIMSILNVTPDSFSDGGSYGSVEDAVKAGLEHVKQGAGIIDIGGVSTRPGSKPVTEEEELRRVIPVVEGLREAGCAVPISVDTYRASVAKATVKAGASIINDISGGLHDPEMLTTVARLDVPFVLMHMRGAPEEVNQKRHEQYEGGDVVGGVRMELAESVKKALNAGIKRWNIILDPGIGFSKDMAGNLALLRDLPALTGGTSHLGRQSSSAIEQAEYCTALAGFPVLIGVSRKGFIGKITGQEDPKNREYANSAIHALAIANGASILRVHNVSIARDAVRIADAIYGKE